MDENVDYKKLYDVTRDYLSRELNYNKLTAVEKLSILLSGIAVVAVIALLGSIALYFITSTVVMLLADALGSEWAANLVVSLLMVVIIVIVVASRKSLIVNPITRYITRLFLNPNNNE